MGSSGSASSGSAAVAGVSGSSERHLRTQVGRSLGLQVPSAWQERSARPTSSYSLAHS